MTSKTKRKHVYAEMLQSELSIPQEKQEIVRVLAGCGNNLHNVESCSGETFLVSMPSKFRKNVWIKRDDFVLVERIPEGDKVKAEIITVLTKDHIRYYKNQNCWPNKFQDDEKEIINRQPNYDPSSSSSSSSDESDE